MAGRGRARFPVVGATLVVVVDALAGLVAGLSGNAAQLRYWGIGVVAIVAAYYFGFQWDDRRRS